MLKCVKVEMPTDRCIINANNAASIPYVYYATEYYRDESGRPRTTRISIGRKDEETGTLIPNDNYFDLFDVEIIIKRKDDTNE